MEPMHYSLLGLLLVFLGLLVGRALNKEAARPAMPFRGYRVAYFGPRNRMLGWVILAIGVAFVFFMVRTFSLDLLVFEVLFLAGVGVLAPVVLLITLYGIFIAYDDEAIYLRSPWRRQRRIAWGEIVSCEYHGTERRYKINTSSGSRFYVQDTLTGKDELLKQIWEHIQARRQEAQ